MKALNNYIQEKYLIDKNTKALSPLEVNVLDMLNDLTKGGPGIITIKNAPAKFDRFMRITYNKCYERFSIGWEIRMGCANHGKSFYSTEDLLNFLKNNDIPLQNLKKELDPDLTNGM